MLTGAKSEAGSIIGALEDNDDGDDTATGNCDWVLSFRDKSELYSLAFKSAAATSAPPRAQIVASAKTEWEKIQLMLMQQHFAQLQHLSEVNFSYHRDNIAFCGSCCCCCCCNCCCNCTLHLGCNFYGIKPELNNLITTEKRFY